MPFTVGVDPASTPKGGTMENRNVRHGHEAADAPRLAGAPMLVATRHPTKDRCPRCGGGVRLDHFDLVDAVASMACTDCGFTYQAQSPTL